jgi:hypothetical protein
MYNFKFFCSDRAPPSHILHGEQDDLESLDTIIQSILKRIWDARLESSNIEIGNSAYYYLWVRTYNFDNLLGSQVAQVAFIHQLPTVYSHKIKPTKIIIFWKTTTVFDQAESSLTGVLLWKKQKRARLKLQI